MIHLLCKLWGLDTPTVPPLMELTVPFEYHGLIKVLGEEERFHAGR